MPATTTAASAPRPRGPRLPFKPAAFSVLSDAEIWKLLAVAPEKRKPQPKGGAR